MRIEDLIHDAMLRQKMRATLEQHTDEPGDAQTSPAPIETPGGSDEH